MVVPDSITPIEGWKSFDLVNGELRSPSYGLVWPVGEPAKAACEHMQFTYSWEISSNKPSEVEEDESYFGPTGPIGPTGARGMLATQFFQFQPSPPPKPKTLLPPGKYWRLEQGIVVHNAPSKECSCGIYIADNVEATANYGSVFGKVHGWGEVVQHTGGYRVQYAYPSELYAHSTMEALELVDYGVPVILKEDVKDPSLRLLLDVPDASVHSEKSGGAPMVVRIGVPFFMGALVAAQGVIAYSQQSIASGVAFGTTAVLAGFSVGISVFSGRDG